MTIPVVNFIGLSIVFCLCHTLATPIVLFSAVEGSTDEEELFNTTSFLPTTYLFSEPQTTPAGPSHVNADVLKQVEDFLRENTLLILVSITLVFLIFLIICGALVMSRRRKVNAYYPSSFPSKMYVDHRDKTGGTKPFNEVPEKTSLEQQSEPLDSHKQLQADIMRAARSLRTATKSAVDENDLKEEDSEEIPKTRDSILDALLPSLPEEKEPCQLSDSEATAVSSEENLSEKSDSQDSLINRSLRPSSLHIHNDTATLQLIAGEKTAF